MPLSIPFVENFVGNLVENTEALLKRPASSPGKPAPRDIMRVSDKVFAKFRKNFPVPGLPSSGAALWLQKFRENVS
jgi:hypothetical protein